MSQQPVIRRHEHRCHIDHEPAERDAATALMWSAHEQDAVGRQLDRPGRVQLQQLALLTLRILRGLQESACVLVRTKEESVGETCLCRALLRAQAQESSHRVASGQGQRACGVGRRMCSSIMREGCCEAELRGGCGMLAVEAMEGAWLLLSLAARRSAHAAYQPRRTALSGLPQAKCRGTSETPHSRNTTAVYLCLFEIRLIIYERPPRKNK